MIADIDKFLQTSALSPATLDIYAHYLVMFAEWTNEKGIAPANVEPLNVMQFLNQYPQWSYSTKHNVCAAIRQFYRYAYSDDHPATRVKIRKIEPPPQRCLSAQELSDLLASIDTNTPTGVRDRAIVCLMADTGMRASEVTNLEIKNMDLTKRQLFTYAKGGRWLQKVFTQYTADMLNKWMEARPQLTKDMKFVFISVGGKRAGTSLTRHGLHSLFERLAVRAGLDDFSPHALRRTFATLAIENGAPTRLVQVAGGWSTISMVERYTRALKPDAISGFSPLRAYDHQNGNEPKG